MVDRAWCASGAAFPNDPTAYASAKVSIARCRTAHTDKVSSGTHLGVVWVAELLISERTAQKIVNLHSITPDEVTQAVVCVTGLEWALDIDEARGERTIVATEIRGRPVLVVLYDAQHPLGDAWRLGSVYFIDD